MIAVTPQIEGQAMVTANAVNLALSCAVSDGPIWRCETVVELLEKVEIAGSRDAGGVLIGQTMAFKMGLKTVMRSL